MLSHYTFATMIFNTEEFIKSGLTSAQFVVLLSVKMKTMHESLFKGDIPIFLEGSLFTKIKGGKEPQYNKYRLSEKGKRAVEILTSPSEDKRAVVLADRITDIYRLNGLQERIGTSNPEIIRLLTWFLAETGCGSNDILQAVNYYILTTEKEFISKISNLIWKRASLYDTKPKLEQSKLYTLLNKK